MFIMIIAGGATHPGPVRRINEDVLLVDNELGLFAVADGMGGHNAGEVASQLAVETIRAFLLRTREGEDVTWPYGIDPALSFDGNRMMTAVRLANRRVFKAGESREEYTGMGTTVVVALVSSDRFVYCSVGDSRLYAFSGDRLEQLTTDDTWAALMTPSTPSTASAGTTTQKEPANPAHPMRHVLTNVVGARDQLECRIAERPLQGAETWLLCSDGVHGALDTATMETMLREAAPADAAQRLIQAAIDRGATDNVTAVVVRYDPSA